MDFATLAKERYSVKKFTDRPIESEKLEAILEAGRVAPTAANKQPVKIYVLQSEDAMKKINECCSCIYGAPTVLMITYDTSEMWANPLEEGVAAGQQDASIVATHMMLQAFDLGVGSCWVNYFSPTQVASAFDLPAEEQVLLLLPIGYAADDAKPLPTHFQMKEKEQLFVTL